MLIGYRMPLAKMLAIHGVAGIGAVWGQRSVAQFEAFANSRISVGRALGFPLESGVWFNMESGFSVGLVGYGNINPEQAFVGLTASMAYRFCL